MKTREQINDASKYVQDYPKVVRTWNDLVKQWLGISRAAHAPKALEAHSFSQYRKPNDPVNVVLLLGPNGGGKNTFIDMGLARFGGKLVARDTIRPPRKRDGVVIEVNGRDYNFITPEQFKLFKAQNQYLFQTDTPHDGYNVLRGIRTSMLYEILDNNTFAIVTGGPKTLAELPEKLAAYTPRKVQVGTVYLLPPSGKTWLSRLVGRSIGDEQQISEIPQRIHSSLAMLQDLATGVLHVDLVVVNGPFRTIYKSAKRIIEAMIQSLF